MAIGIPNRNEPFLFPDGQINPAWYNYLYLFSNNINSAVTNVAGGIIDSKFTQVGTVGAAASELMSSELGMKQFNEIGSSLEIIAWGETAVNGNTKLVEVIAERPPLGDVLLLGSTEAAVSGVWWNFVIQILRISVNQVTVSGNMFVSSGLWANRVESQATLAIAQDTPITLKLVGDGGATNDIVQYGLLVKWFPAA